ncbi:hypothetical protein [Streptomyces sp. CB01881]|uniref:hypothetical protein n=1 Tax=Streptomyces sp. CB01881 TaxID=2078691 RepID=UPI000CDC134E|nr:hypothetical protein [Streptomyces sp. CB01881]AUY52049.1 hypothetical protein C2142_27520 [Streptomyces sp. CB01881]TYC71476.1 hypothetical protein EH183_27510 [Streptomyces sp. CB01881]
MSRTLLRGAQVITMTPDRPDAEHVDILVDGETIAAVGETIEAPRLRAGARCATNAQEWTVADKPRTDRPNRPSGRRAMRPARNPTAPAPSNSSLVTTCAPSDHHP